MNRIEWVAEMFGYVLAAAHLGLRHEIVDLQMVPAVSLAEKPFNADFCECNILSQENAEMLPVLRIFLCEQMCIFRVAMGESSMTPENFLLARYQRAGQSHPRRRKRK